MLPVFLSGANAQDDVFRAPSVQVGNTTLICKDSFTGAYFVHDAANDTTPYTRQSDEFYSSNLRFKSQYEIHRVVGEVFTSERQKELLENEISFPINLTVNDQGKIVQTNYSIKFESKLKPSEIAKFDSLFKQRIRFTTDEFKRTGEKKTTVSFSIYFQKILNKEKIISKWEWEY